MIGKFINPIVSGAIPSAEGIYTISPSQTIVTKDAVNFSGVIKLNSDFSINTSFNLPVPGLFRSSGTFIVFLYDLKEQVDGKIIIAGSFNNIGGGYQIYGTSPAYIMRLNSNGSYDSTFNSGGVGSDNTVRCVEIDNVNDKILIGGSFTNYNGVSRVRIARLNSDGSNDTSFVIGTGFNSDVNFIKLQSDGKIIVVGAFSSYNSVSANRIIRLNTDGSIDSSFTIGTGFSGTTNSVAITGTGKIYVVGNFGSYNGISTAAVNSLARLNSDGTLDSSFVKTVSIGTQMNTVLVQSDGKVIAGGSYCPSGSTGPCGVVRFNDNGSIDNIFVKPGFYSTFGANIVRDILQQTDGKLIIIGTFERYNGNKSSRIIRINLDGSLDTAFDELDFTYVNDLSMVKGIILSDSTIMMVGSPNNKISNDYYPGLITKLSNYNTIDRILVPEFVTSTDASSSRNLKISMDNFDNIFISGDLTKQIPTQTSSGASIGISKYDYDFKITEDLKFYEPFLYSSYNSTNITNIKVLITSDNKILVSGSAITIFENLQVRSIFRMNNDFSRDTTFNLANGFTFGGTQYATEMFETDSLKYFLAFTSGTNTIYNSVSYSGFIRINNDGSVDGTFAAQSFASSSSLLILSIITQPDGKIVIVGNFITHQTVSRRFISRLNSNGTIDTSFDPGTSFNNVLGTSTASGTRKISITTSGKFIAVGSFYSYQGFVSTGIVLINSDGSIDLSFNANVGIGFDGPVDDFAIDSIGRIYIVGRFNSYNGNVCKGYCVLEPDGTFIPTGIEFIEAPTSILIKE